MQNLERNWISVSKHQTILIEALWKFLKESLERAANEVERTREGNRGQ